MRVVEFCSQGLQGSILVKIIISVRVKLLQDECATSKYKHAQRAIRYLCTRDVWVWRLNLVLLLDLLVKKKKTKGPFVSQSVFN